MDFNELDSRTAADEGRWMHVIHPATGEPMYDGEGPCEVLCRGSEGREVQREVAKMRAASVALQDAKDESADEQTMAELHDKLAKAVTPFVVGFRNINNGDKPAKAPKDVSWFLDLNMVNGQRGEFSFAEQIARFATRRASFLGASSKS